MTSYARAWLAVALLLGALGAVEAALAVPTLTVWTVAVAVGAVSGLTQLSFSDRAGGAWKPGRATVSAVAVGAAAGACTAGLVAVLDGGGAALAVLVACGHPRLVAAAARRVHRVPRPHGGAEPQARADPRASAPAPTTGSTTPRDWASKVIPTRGSERRWPDVAGVRRLSLTELCLGWRTSFTALDRADPRVDHRRWEALVAVRQRYLDEIARRDPAGFARWIYAGARPASDPSPYLLGASRRGLRPRAVEDRAPRD